MIDYKNTLNLPFTGFPMRGNLAKREPRILQRWYEQDLYGIIRNAKKGKKTFILHDGAPYANGSIHIGHSVNKILKDIIIKYKGLMGYDSPYIPGWDCHGLPIELKVEQVIGKPGQQVSSAQFRLFCRKYAAEQVAKQKKDFIRLGVLGDWDHPYLTMDFNTEANIIRTLSKIIINRHLYKGLKPVHWCTNCYSSLAEAEVEYHNLTSASIDVAFTSVDSYIVANKFGIRDLKDPISLIIWTTMPWTLPANRAICINPEFDYTLVDVNRYNKWIIAANLVEIVMQRAGIQKWSVLGHTKGRSLEFLRFLHPFMNFDVPIILGYHVTLSSGTGAVHTAPGHGPDDYIIGQQYSLEIYNPVGPDGCYLPETHPKLDGLSVFNVNNIIIDLLRKKKALLSFNNLNHSYPYCWRHKTPVIFRSTPQWFISLDQNGLREKSIAEIRNVQWIPEWGQAHIENMVHTRTDWCISRQRTWGVPMSLFVHNDTKDLHPRTPEILEEVAQRVEKDGIQAWWDLDAAEILGDDSVNYTKVEDTLDVWFDSGSTHASVVDVRSEFNGYKPDMYLEGSDQHRGWFMSSLIISSAIKGRAPYRQVLTHGFTVDSHGLKMSKSIGNVITPQEVIDELGSDVLRLWVASTDYSSEIAVSNEILKSTVESYRRIRNTARFILANLHEFDPSQHIVNQKQMVLLDVWAVGRAKSVQAEIISYYECYDLHKVVQRIVHFCSVEMGSFYLDTIKDRLYTAKSNSIARRSGQTAMFHIIEALVRWISPIISFTADEIWGFIPGNRSQFVFTEEWYQGLFYLDNSQKMQDTYWDTIIQVRNEVNKVIERARANKTIGSSLEAQITLYAEPLLADKLRALGDELCFGLLTSRTIIADYNTAESNAVQSEELKSLKIALTKASGNKCPRCWHYELDISHNTDDIEICDRCVINTLGPGEKRKFI